MLRMVFFIQRLFQTNRDILLKRKRAEPMELRHLTPQNLAELVHFEVCFAIVFDSNDQVLGPSDGQRSEAVPLV